MQAKGTKKQPHRNNLMFPLVSRANSFSKLSQSQFAELEAAGRISLTPEARRVLNAVADSWISHDAALQSPRPAEFRARLRAILDPLEAANAAATELDGDNATVFDHHLFHWLFMGDLPGAGDARVQLGYLPHLVGFFKNAEQALPADSGSARPKDDQRFIRNLAAAFEECGGTAKAYVSAHADEGYAETPFRQFVQKFYEFLPLKSRRTRRGLDESIRRTLLDRRKAVTV